MSKRAYIRCNGGDYFQGELCPLDGWSSDESRELAKLDALLEARGEEISFANLRKVGASESTIRRTIIIEFGADDSAFEALFPKGFSIGGEYVPLGKAGPDLN